MWALVKPEVAHAPNQRSISGLIGKKYCVTHSHALKLVAKYYEAWMKNVVLVQDSGLYFLHKVNFIVNSYIFVTMVGLS